VPSAPKIPQTHGAIRGVEIERQHEAEQKGDAYRHIRIAEKSKIDLKRETPACDPRIGQARRLVVGGGEQRSDELRQGIGNEDFFHQSDDDQRQPAPQRSAASPLQDRPEFGESTRDAALATARICGNSTM